MFTRPKLQPSLEHHRLQSMPPHESIRKNSPNLPTEPVLLHGSSTRLLAFRGDRLDMFQREMRIVLPCSGVRVSDCSLENHDSVRSSRDKCQSLFQRTMQSKTRSYVRLMTNWQDHQLYGAIHGSPFTALRSSKATAHLLYPTGPQLAQI
jgi:hypothetical protein